MVSRISSVVARQHREDYRVNSLAAPVILTVGPTVMLGSVMLGGVVLGRVVPGCVVLGRVVPGCVVLGGVILVKQNKSEMKWSRPVSGR